MNLGDDLNLELKTALQNVIIIRDNLQKTLMETYDEELLDKIIYINKQIKNAEILLSRKENVKEFYAKNYPQFVDNNKDISNTGIKRISILKKKWKKLGYLK